MARVKRHRKEGATTGVRGPDWSNIHPDMKPVMYKEILRDYNRLFWEASQHTRCMSNKELKSAFLVYCGQHFDKRGAAKLKELPEYEFNCIGQYAFMALRGLTLTEYYLKVIKSSYETLLAQAEAQAEQQAEEAPPAPARVVSIQERMREQVSDMCANWEALLDDIVTNKKVDVAGFDPYKDIRANESEVKPAHARIIRDWYVAQRDEAQAVLDQEDEQVIEGYSNLKPKARKQMFDVCDKIVTVCDSIINAGKAVRKPRKRKSPSKEKLIKNVKFLEKDTKLGLASINPISVLGQSVLWTYDTKRRKLAVFQAPEGGHLGVKGTTITGFDDLTSFQKTIRKPDMLKGADKLSRTKFQKLFDGIRATETKVKGRLNENMLLVKVF